MKRSIEDVEAQIRGRPVSSRAETPLRIGGGRTMGPLSTSEALTYLKAVKEMFKDNKVKYETFLEVMKDFRAQRINTNGVVAKVKDLFKGHDDLLLGFNNFLPKGYKITLHPENEKPKKPIDYNVAIEFVNKIKARYGGDDRAFKKFLDILNMYKVDRKSVNEVYEEVTLLFQDQEDLLKEFFVFLPDYQGSDPVDNPLSGRNTVTHDINSPFSAMHPKHFEKKIKITENSDREDGDENLVPYSAGNSLGRSLAHQGQCPGYVKVEDTEGTQKNIPKGINELDLSNCVQCTPSYRRLPEHYPIQIASYRNSIGKKVLNDHWVSVTSGSEDYSFKHMRKNHYEESLFKCEDDRYEFDMLVESARAATKSVENLLEKISNNTISIETPIRIKEHLSDMNLRCIERLYGENGLDLIEYLKTNCRTALPVILARLKQKQEEWAKWCPEFRKLWAGVQANNHHKSLDHRSFIFKQQDSKNVSTKGLVTEIKDISERKQKEDLFPAFAVGTKPSFTPDMEFSYTDTQVHDDLYQLIKYYSEKSAIEQSEKVMKLWVTFLEPLFGLPSRSLTNETMKDVAKNEDQEHHDACEAVKGNTCDGSLASNHNPLIPSKTPNKENPTGKGSSFSQDFPASTREIIQQNKLRDGATITNEDSHPSKLVSPRNDLTMEVVDNRSKVSDVSMGGNQVEREEGELSPSESSEHDNFEVYKENGLEPVQKLADDEGGNKDQKQKDSTYGTEAGARSNDLPKDDENTITQKLSEGHKNASNIIVSASNFGGQVSSDEDHKGTMDCDRRNIVAETEKEAGGMVNSNEGEDGTFFTFSEQYLQPVKPLAKYVPRTLQASECDSRNDSRVFYGNQSFYVLFRLHQILYERIQSVKIHSGRKRETPDSTSTDSYTRFKEALYKLLDNSINNTKFEDECRDIIGAQESYVLSTLDKLVYKFVKHLHAVAADETDIKLLQLYAYENYRKPERCVDIVYHENARALLHEQSIYRIQYSSSQTRLSIQLMNSGNNQLVATAVRVESGFANYLQNEFLSCVREEENPGLYLKRNKARLSGMDESSGLLRATEGLKIVNEVECKIACSSSKVKYEPNTEDILYRRKQKKAIMNLTISETARMRRMSRFNIMVNRRFDLLPCLDSRTCGEVRS